MSADPGQVGRKIYILRKQKGMTQNQLGERIHVSFQAVSKWERGETLPDASLLPELAQALGTSIDNILIGGDGEMAAKKPEEFTRRVTVAQMREGIECFERMGELLGKDSLFYYGAVGGVNLRMNMELEESLEDPYTKECLVAEAAIQAMMNGAYMDPEDIRTGFQFPRWAEIVGDTAREYGIR